VNAQDLFETITAQLIADIEAGTPEWRMPWRTLADAGTPTNLNGRPYRGMNALWLPMVAATRGWDLGLWGTYKGWQQHGGQVRRGEHGTQVVLWKPTTKTADDSEHDDTATPGRRGGLIARAYTVFAAEQVDGADDLISRRRQPQTDRDTPERIAAADAYFHAVGATVIEGGNIACYQPGTDTIRLPVLERFDSAAHYYSTRAHETTHWTGHPSRLARDLTGRFGSDAYGAEELVAELGAAMWSAQAGISSATRTDHAAYLGSWLRILRADARSLITVASKAQAALDYLNTAAGIARAA
jgi:antirestriction protein ArdC